VKRILSSPLFSESFHKLEQEWRVSSKKCRRSEVTEDWQDLGGGEDLIQERIVTDHVRSLLLQ